MTILAVKTCVTCSKSCYPTERLMVSDLWVHKAGCMKCSTCNATLSLNSVYVAPSPLDPARKLLWCAKDVPKMVHTSVVDSIALKTAMNAPKCTTTPTAVFAKSKSQGKTLRFKGLTLRSKSIAQGLNAPKPDSSNGRQQAQQIFVGHVGAGLDSWDIAHAMAVQSQVRSPIRSHPAIHAQHTGSSSVHALSPHVTGNQVVDAADDEGEKEITSAKTGEEAISIEPDLVKNLIRVFQLDSVDAIEVLPSADPAEDDILVVPDVIFDAAQHLDGDIDHDVGEDVISGLASVPSQAGIIEPPSPEMNPLLAALPGTIGRSAYYGTLKPSSSTISTLSDISSISHISGLSDLSIGTQCGTYRASGMGSFRSTLTVRTLGTIGSKRGTLTLARIKGALRRPGLGGLFPRPEDQERQEQGGQVGLVVTASEEDSGDELLEYDDFASKVGGDDDGSLSVPDVPAVPANTPIKSPRPPMSRTTLPETDSRTGTIRGRFSSVRSTKAGAEYGSVRGTGLLKALLPLAAHLVPLPVDDDEGLFENGGEMQASGDKGHGYFGPNSYADGSYEDVEEDEEEAEQALIDGLKLGGLELIMLFEEEAEPLPVSSGL